MRKIRILLADDHPLVRAGMRAVLNSELDMEVVGEACDGTSCLEQTQALKPDVVVMDITMGNMSGLAATRQVRARFPESRVLVLTMHENEEYLRQMLDAGASGYVIKKASGSELALAIRAVQRGELYVHSSLMASLLQSGPARPVVQTRPDALAKLSQREREVLRLVAQGYSSRQIAEKLFLSARTVDTYRARVMEKLHLTSRVALFNFALSNGLIGDNENSPSSG